ncbi:hypothetical protein MNBD_NITROSPINAE03-1098 [hydrothermal vent metagenome]|uniref:Response regulatory domain-containing protein n=1 Tax=hydrothermal vent metagenome TaxID=652676 RepID=A0A3B1C1D7_9ZZZZ
MWVEKMATVLIVDDIDGVRRSLKKVVMLEGHDVLEAEDGEQAIRLLKENLPDLLITDIYMPGMDGLELIGKLRSDYPDLKIIAISGGQPGEGEDEIANVLSQAVKFGADKGLAKPYSLDEMQKAIREFI